MDLEISEKKLEINSEKVVEVILNNEDEQHFTYLPNEKDTQIMSEYLSGNWQNFFNIWSTSFTSVVKEKIEYKIMSLKLRVHFAILPIRIVQLHQNKLYVSTSPSKVSTILKNAADKFNSTDDEKDFEDEQNKLTIDCMKQLEDFLNSFDGQKLTTELKESSLMTFFALPYIFNPHEDESMKKVFSIDWLEELIIDLEAFINKYFQVECLIEQKLEISEYNISFNMKETNQYCTQAFTSMNDFLETENDFKSKLSICNNELISRDRIIHSAAKTKEIEDWIEHHQHLVENNNLCTRSTQTHLSCIKTGTGFSLISEPRHTASIVTPNIPVVPSKQSVIYNDELNSTKSRLFNVYKHYKKLKLRFHKLHEDYEKMNEIAEKLTIALESSVRGEPINLDTITQSCMKIFPNRFNRDLQTDSEDTNIDLKEDFSNDVFSIEEKLKVLNNIPLPPKLLDYKKIKLHLKKGNVKTKLLLLQALRQKLTLNQPKHRDETIREYLQNDLLELQGNAVDIHDNVLSYILRPINSDISISLIQQTTARFLNAVASLSCGRAYLTNGPIVLNVIIKYLNSYNDEATDPITLDMILATLQKMSLRKQQRNYMIEANLVEWLIHHLSSENFRMGAYRLEYTCALLMNLSLQSAARDRASMIAPLFTSTMTSLLSTDCVSILPYVTGALQNFLMNNEINEESKKLHFAAILEYHCKESNEELSKHFSRTLKIHKRECEGNLLDDDQFPDEDDEIFDVLENELEENDPVRCEIGELQGENLLTVNYCLPASFVQSKNLSNKNAVQVSTTQTENLLNNESTRAELNAPMIIAGSETTFVDSKTETFKKKSGTEVANSSKKTTSINKGKIKSRHKEEQEEEDAFTAKPKLMRTPPTSARMEMNEGKILRTT